MIHICKLFLCGMALIVPMFLIVTFAKESVSADNYVKEYIYTDSLGDNARAIINTVYYDGLGRERLAVNGYGGDPGYSVSKRSDYDRRGNLFKTWLPVPGDVENLVPSKYESEAESLYGIGEIPYSITEYELMGANRPYRLSGPGKHWQRKAQETYWTRNKQSGDYSCRRLRIIADGSVYVDGIYEPGTLRVIEVTDEDGMRILEFQDRLNRTILYRRIGGGMTCDTRIVYDQRGDLRYAISPEGCALLPTSGKVDNSILDKYAQSQEYDFLHRCISQKLLSAGDIEYVYDRMGNLMMSSDAQQRTKGEWTLTLYDRNLRPAVQGIVSLPGKSREQLQDIYGDSQLIASFTTDYNLLETTLLYRYDIGAAFTPHMAWYYDNYEFMIGNDSQFKNRFAIPTTSGHTALGLCTGMAFISDGAAFYKATKYDSRGNLVCTAFWDCFLNNQRYLCTVDYDFTGHPLTKTEVLEQMTEGTTLNSREAKWQYSYDDMGRLINQSLSVDSSTPIKILDNYYDNIGRLDSQWRGIDVTMGYDIRQHLSSIQSDVYTQQSCYEDSEFSDAISYKYVNHISESWNNGGQDPLPYSQTQVMHYDGLGRLTKMTSPVGDASEEIDVDLNATVVGITRFYRGAVVQEAVIDMDGMLPTDLRDASAPYYQEAVGRFPAGDYTITHDLCGRLTSDSSRGIQSVSYHPWNNLPKMIKLEDSQYVNNRYLPDGTLLSRSMRTKRIVSHTRVDENGDTIVTDKRRDYTVVHNYTGSFERVNGLTSYLRINTPTGYWDSRTRSHFWYITDRLGSVTAVVDSVGKIQQRTGYYPSGTPYILPPDLDRAETTGVAPTMTPASERLHIGNIWVSHCGLNWYDNTARMHDPILMRFTTPDPLYGKYPDLSPWSHCAANPVNAIDQSGKNFYEVKKNGMIVLKMIATGDDVIISKETQERITIPYTFFNDMEFKEYGNYYITLYHGDSDQSDLYRFLIRSTNVEWSHLLFADGSSTIGTINQKHKEATPGYYYNYRKDELTDLLIFSHNHPSGSWVASDKDMNMADCLEKCFPEIICYIITYNDETFKNYQYDSNGNIQLFITNDSHEEVPINN